MAGLQADRDIIAGLAEAKRDEYELEKKGIISPTSSAHEHELDGIHDGLEFPTEEERHSLRRVADHVPWNAYCKLSKLHCRQARSLIRGDSDRVCRVVRTLFVLRHHGRLRTSFYLSRGITIAGVHMVDSALDELYPATASPRLKDRRSRSAWPGRCPWNGPAGLNGFNHFQLVLVSNRPCFYSQHSAHHHAGSMSSLSLVPTLPTRAGVVSRPSVSLSPLPSSATVSSSSLLSPALSSTLMARSRALSLR